eukprot:TRINITY_DN8741_c0_g2_i10.p1 TRINITY_DN8741_c0_g2~~TRINITY_DN8741_c0_g2_i10.p1  ORF type:complete len:281 (-),score=35.90 TRINITY_DN8741_c0_g2_i10:57-899(-)
MENWYINSAENIIRLLSHELDDEMFVIADSVSIGKSVKVMEHLTCFAGGMLALGSQHIDNGTQSQKHMLVAKGLAKLCKKMYDIHETGLHSENVKVLDHTVTHGSDHRFMMRPEAVETWFYLYRITNDSKYREWGWDYMQALNKYSKQTYGYSGLRNSNPSHLIIDDIQQSWFLAETLKYLYLLFSPHDVIPLSEFIFNTEAHPLPLFDPSTSFDLDPFNMSDFSMDFDTFPNLLLFPLLPPWALMFFLPVFSVFCGQNSAEYKLRRAARKKQTAVMKKK